MPRLADPEALVQAPQRRRRPPVPLAEQLHQRGDQQGADDARVDQHRERGADAVLLDEDDLRGGEGADRDREQQRRGGDDPAGPLEPDRHRLRVRGAVVARLLDPREQEDGVVGREPEGDGEEQDRHRLLDRPGAGVVEEALEAAVLEDQHQQAEDGAEVEDVHDQRLDRQHHRAGHQEEDRPGSR